MLTSHRNSHLRKQQPLKTWRVKQWSSFYPFVPFTNNIPFTGGINL